MEEKNFYKKPLLENPDNNIFKQELKPSRPWYRRWWIYVYGVVFIFSLAVLIVFSQQTNQVLNQFDYEQSKFILDGADNKQSILPGASQSEAAAVTALDKVLAGAADDPALGNPEADIVIVEFADFECPYCQQSAPIIRKLLANYENEIYFIYRDFPITELHPNAFTAALAGQCAGEQGLFWPLHDLMFANQESLNSDFIKKLAVKAGLDAGTFNTCLDNKKYSQEVLGDFESGVNLGVSGTPTFFVNGYSVSGVVPFDKWEELIQILKLTQAEE